MVSRMYVNEIFEPNLWVSFYSETLLIFKEIPENILRGLHKKKFFYLAKLTQILYWRICFFSNLYMHKTFINKIIIHLQL